MGFESYAADTTAGAGTAYALHADRQGSVIAVTDQATNTVVARYSYDAFGAREQTVSAVLQDYGCARPVKALWHGVCNRCYAA